MSASEEPSAPPSSSASCSVHFAGVRRPLTVALGGDVEHTTVDSFRTKIIEALREAHEHPPAYVRILFRGTELAEDDAPLSRYLLANGSTVHAVAAQRPGGQENIDRTLQRTFASIFGMIGSQGEQGGGAPEGQAAAAAATSSPQAGAGAGAGTAAPAAAAPSREEAAAHAPQVDVAEADQDGVAAEEADTRVWFQLDEEGESLRLVEVASLFTFFLIGFFFGPVAFLLPIYRLESSACVAGILLNLFKNLFDVLI